MSFILLLIFRRKVLINADKPALYEDIIAAVKLAEERWPDGNGDKKLKFVNDWLKEKKGAFFYSVMAPFINQCVEAVLSTPQKKEK